MPELVVICNGITCRKYGSLELLNFIQGEKVKGVEIKKQYCFGKCGNGCVVFSLPEEIFYTYVNKKVLFSIIQGEQK